MRTYILIQFWLSVASVVAYTIRATVVVHPRTVSYSIGDDLLGVIIAQAWVVWGGLLLWWLPS